MKNWVSSSFLGLILLLGISCAGVPKSSANLNFIGHVYEQKWNAMPMVDKPSSKGSPFSTMIYLYEPTKIDQIEGGMPGSPIVSRMNSRLVDSVRSDKTGAFLMYLKPGKYSLFIKYENGYYIPFFAGKDWVSIIEVKPNEITTMDFIVSGILNNE